MNFTGETLLHAGQKDVWTALLDPEAIRRCLPGCQRLDAAGADTFEATVSVGIGAVKGTYSGTVRISDQEPPTGYTISIEGTGSSGTVQGSGRIELSGSDQETTVRWTADVQIGGPIASVGQRLIGGVAKLVAGDFFKCMDRHVTQAGATQQTATQGGT